MGQSWSRCTSRSADGSFRSSQVRQRRTASQLATIAVRIGANLRIRENDTLRVLPIRSRGSSQNLSDILDLKDANIGFVQSDVLVYTRKCALFFELAQNIRSIARMSNEDIRFLACHDITRLEDLNGQRGNLEVTGNGSTVTADILLDALGIKPKIEPVNQVSGMQASQRGDIAAIIQATLPQTQC